MKLIILDRDGVINHDSPHYIKSPDEWHPLPNSLDAIAQLKQAGFTVAVASNQSGIARGYYTHDILNAIHDKMQGLLSQVNAQVDSIHYCPHLPAAACDCRKPMPGLLHEIGKRYQVDLNNVPFVGDRASDIQTASQVGAKAIWVATGYSDESEKLAKLSYPFEKFDDLSAVAAHLCAY